MHTPKPFAESCEQNKQPILSVLKPLLQTHKNVLEIGSGTGQHAVFFAAQLPHLIWQTSDLKENHLGIEAWIHDAELPNVLAPIELDALAQPWPANKTYDAVFTANTFHIMSWDAVKATLTGLGKLLEPSGIFIVYGPFNYNGQYTSESNQRFDLWLKARDPMSGIRDLSDLTTEAQRSGLVLIDDIEMPVNNRILVWQRRK